jgi:hypothetical protein
MLAFIVLTGAFPVQALVCSVPGTTSAWATDQCLLETGESGESSKTVLDCLSRMNTIKQPCEWNATYKRKYCETLIGMDKFNGTTQQCLADPETIGPAVRQVVGEQSGGA